MAAPAPLGWPGILRLGLVQTAIGAVVVLTTSAINRVMVVELALPAALPGLLVGLHYAVQVLRPRLGHGSDVGGRRTRWILGGMGLLALGGVLAAAATALADLHGVAAGLALAVPAFLLIGIGVGAAGTSVLALLAGLVAPARRAAAASTVWIMMIAGFVVTTAAAGRLLDPYSPARLVAVSAGISALAFLLALAAAWGVEPRGAAPAAAERGDAGFREALAEVWAEPEARRFTLFVFLSMLAYSAQDLVLEPFAGQVFGLSLGETTRLASVQHGGVLAGMVLVALAGGRGAAGALGAWVVGGCAAAAAGMAVLAAAGLLGGDWPLGPLFFGIGLADGAFAAAAIASMMQLAGRGPPGREGLRMGLWGAAQAIAFGLGGLAGALAVDLGRWLLGSAPGAYAAAFAGDAVLFLAAAGLAATSGRLLAGRVGARIMGERGA